MKLLMIIGLLAGSLGYANADSCRANYYFTTTIASAAYFSPATCGKVNLTQKWSARCVSSFIRNAFWHGNLTTRFSPSRNTFNFTNGAISYFVIETQPSLCREKVTVPTKDAMLMGTLIRNDGRSQKLYAVLDRFQNYNVLVTLSRGINSTYGE
jgi:hypothetical protein